MEKEILYTIQDAKKGTKLIVYKNGEYHEETIDQGVGAWGMTGSIYEYSGIISAQYNQLKAKLFNTIEASIIEKEQREAVKGLIKGFCNEQYRNTIKDVKGLLIRMGLIDESNPENISFCEDVVNPLGD